MALTEAGQQKQEWLAQISSRALELLKQEPNKIQQMDWAQQKLEEADLYRGNSPPLNPRAWVEQVIARNLDLMDDSIPWLEERDSHPEKAQTFDQLILSLIPSESGQ